MKNYAHVNFKLLHWARERAQLPLENLAKKLKVDTNKIEAWENGKLQLTFRQAKIFANATYVPFGFLFLKSPPKETIPLPDLRTLESKPYARPSVNLIDILHSVLQKQAWYLDYLHEHNYLPLDFIGKFTVTSSVIEVVQDIKKKLEIKILREECKKQDEYFRSLVKKAEDKGILVMRSGIVENNTHRKLDVKEFRGFVISDKLAPLVFINSSDAPAARLFTLIHELAHLWIGKSGISDTSPNSTHREEVFCNAVAGEFLVPKNEFHARWQVSINWKDNLSKLANHFHVSKLVIVRRALDLKYIKQRDYDNFYQDVIKAFREEEKKGGSFYRNAKTKNSSIFSHAVISETLSGRLLLRDAGKLLGIQPNKIKEYAGHIAE